MAEQRELILKLGQMITDRIGHKVTVDDPEYWGLECVVTDEMAEVALKMGVRKPKTLAQLVKLTGKDEKELESLLFDMALAGLIEYNWENEQKEKQYVLPMFVPGSAEFTNMNWQQLQEKPQLAHFFERMSRLPLEKVTPMVPPGGAGIGMHVIPVEKAIEAENVTAKVEHISHWLDKYEGQFAASPCSCRMSRQIMDEGCGDSFEDWCIAVGDMADYIVETGRGRYIDRKEALEIMERAEKNGFVHQITNIDGENKIFGICNCNVNVCYALRTSQLFNTPNLSRSAYVARTKKENCVACGRCVEYCPAGAVKLGQKICKADGSQVEYPKHDLPDRMKWGPEKWDEDYRDNNRINCYDTGTAPCKSTCPAHIAVQGYLNMASQGRYKEALALIKKENPFPAVCGRVCNRRCEDACTRGTIDEAVAIDDVKKFIAAQDLNAETRFIPEKVIPSNRGGFDEKIAIIGGGPAGLSCAYYLAEKGYRPTVFEKNEKPGGMLVYGIPSFKLEKDVVEAEIDVIRALGVEIRCGVEVGKDITLRQLRDEGYKGFYIAIGCQGGRKAGIPGEDGPGVMTAVDFLKTVNGNEEYTVEGKTVVIGGGNVAVDVSRCAIRCRSREVDIYSLEQREEMPASEEELLEAEAEGIRVNCGYGPAEIIREDGRVTGIVLKKCVNVFDEEGKFSPVFDENDTVTVPCDNVFISIGQSILWGNLLDGEENMEMGRGNTVSADPLTARWGETDMFAGGDVCSGPSFAIEAIAAGKEGAVSLHRFVQPNASLTIGRNRRQFIQLDKDNISAGEYDREKRQKACSSKSTKELSFRDCHGTLTEEQVKKETARCLGCGASVVDENKCIGCGVCTTKCEFDAIHLYREHPECSEMVKAEDKMKKILPYMAKRAVKIRFGGKK